MRARIGRPVTRGRRGSRRSGRTCSTRRGPSSSPAATRSLRPNGRHALRAKARGSPAAPGPTMRAVHTHARRANVQQGIASRAGAAATGAHWWASAGGGPCRVVRRAARATVTRASECATDRMSGRGVNGARCEEREGKGAREGVVAYKGSDREPREPRGLGMDADERGRNAFREGKGRKGKGRKGKEREGDGKRRDGKGGARLTARVVVPGAEERAVGAVPPLVARALPARIRAVQPVRVAPASAKPMLRERPALSNGSERP